VPGLLAGVSAVLGASVYRKLVVTEISPVGARSRVKTHRNTREQTARAKNNFFFLFFKKILSLVFNSFKRKQLN
jgi:hypothetical protein